MSLMVRISKCLLELPQRAVDCCDFTHFEIVLANNGKIILWDRELVYESLGIKDCSFTLSVCITR